MMFLWSYAFKGLNRETKFGLSPGKESSAVLATLIRVGASVIGMGLTLRNVGRNGKPIRAAIGYVVSKCRGFISTPQNARRMSPPGDIIVRSRSPLKRETLTLVTIHWPSAWRDIKRLNHPGVWEGDLWNSHINLRQTRRSSGIREGRLATHINLLLSASRRLLLFLFLSSSCLKHILPVFLLQEQATKINHYK